MPTSFSTLKGRDLSLGFARSMDFARISDLKIMKSGRKKFSVIRNSNPGQDIAELQSASPGTPLTGILFLMLLCFFALHLIICLNGNHCFSLVIFSCNFSSNVAIVRENGLLLSFASDSFVLNAVNQSLSNLSNC